MLAEAENAKTKIGKLLYFERDTRLSRAPARPDFRGRKLYLEIVRQAQWTNALPVLRKGKMIVKA